MKKWHDKKILKREFIEGDLVMLYKFRMHLFHRKLKSRWSGLFKIIEVLANGVAKVENHKGERFKTNGQSLKKYYGKLQMFRWFAL